MTPIFRSLQNCQFHHRRLESLEHFNVLYIYIYIILSTTVSHFWTLRMAGSFWGQDKETLLLTYNALGKSIASYAAPVWSTNASDSSFTRIQTAQNAALRTATGAHSMASIDHLHQESLTLRVKDHSDMRSVQYLVNGLEEDHVNHGITIQEPRHAVYSALYNSKETTEY